MNGKETAPLIRNFGLVDIFVTLIFLSTAAVSIYLFRLDLMRTIDSYDEEPAGIIVIRNNVIQRRHADRVLWDRIFVDSPVYIGDLIRAADLSAATVYIDDNHINLNENTLIQIQRTADGKGPYQIELQEGNLSLATGTEGSGLMLNLMGRLIQATPETVLNAEMRDEGMVIQVNEGNVTFIEEGQSRELIQGMMIAQDTSGAERIIPAAVVTSPRPNARYLKNSPDPLSVNFIWNCINIEAGQPLRLEIAGDPRFTRNLKIIEELADHVQAAFEAGLWYWRLFYGNAVLATGQFTVTDVLKPQLLSPAMNSVFRYYDDLPQIRFQWTEIPGVSFYIIEIDESATFTSPRINRESKNTSFIQTAPGPGGWYWRVRPVFSSAYEGLAHDMAGYSIAASFRIEQTNDPRLPVLELPDPVRVILHTGNRAVAGENYSVQPDDTLERIALEVYGDAFLWTLIADANGLVTPNLIYPEQVLYLPLPE